jgi:hypothetical protein
MPTTAIGSDSVETVTAVLTRSASATSGPETRPARYTANASGEG